MRILITGSAGFIGSHLARKLRQEHDVFGLDLKQMNHGRDITHEAAQWFRGNENPIPWDLVIHCAAHVGGRVAIEDFPLAYANNLEVDAALFQWAEHVRPRRIIYVSSVAAYPVALQRKDGYPLAEDEIDLMAPELPDKLYGWAKLTGEYLASQAGFPVSVVRPFTVYGEGQALVHPFANFLWQVRDRRNPVMIWGSGNQVRDFIHVDDVVNGILAVAAAPPGPPVNLCTGTGTNLNMVVDIMTAKAGYSPAIRHLDRPEGLFYRVGNPDRLHEFYKPRVCLEEGIERGLQ